ncbi:MAG: rhomboid family intramembrane serine protease [Bacteroidales bacterium]
MHLIRIGVIIILIISYVITNIITVEINEWSYMLMHANIFHLACNCWCAYFVINDRLINRWLLLPLLAVIGAFAYVVTPVGDIPTVGVSGALLAMVGINLSMAMTKRNLIMVGVMLLVWGVFPMVSFGIHAVGLAIGWLIGIFMRYYYDNGGVNRN